MKKILKVTYFLFFMIFSLNVHSQSEKLKELQQTLEDWENFSFELYVLKMDKDQVYSRLEGRKGSLVRGLSLVEEFGITIKPRACRRGRVHTSWRSRSGRL